MAFNTFSKLLSLAAVVAVANAEYWIFGGSRPIVTTRLDPIIFPNSVNTASLRAVLLMAKRHSA